MTQDSIFGASKPDKFQVSVSSLTLGTLYEAIIAFSSHDNFDQFTFDVCSGA